MSEQENLVHRVEDDAQQLVTYSNLCGVSVSAEDAILHFGQRRSETPHIATGVAKVYLSLPNLKRLRKALDQIIVNYEGLFGEIDDDPAAKVAQILKSDGIPNANPDSA